MRLHTQTSGHGISNLRSLHNRTFMLGAQTLTILPADKQIGVPICTKCWRFRHRKET